MEDSDENECPKCSTVIHETNPLELLRADQTLEDIIFKLVPNLQENERQREAKFNESHKTRKIKAVETGLQSTKRLKGSDWETKELHQNNYHRDDPQIAFCLDCENSGEVSGEFIQPLAKRFIKSSTRLTIGHLKKYLRLKLNLSNKNDVDILCNGEIMGKDHTLEFIYMTRWRLKSEHLLTLHYRSQEVFLT